MHVWWRWCVALVFFLSVGAAGAWVAGNPGDIQLDVIGYRVLMPLWVLAVTILSVILIGCFMVWSWMRLRLWRMRRVGTRQLAHQRQGLLYTTQLISALSSGDSAGAQKAWHHCRKMLGDAHPLVQLCGLHVAMQTGETGLTRTHLLALQAHPETQFLAHTALMKEALHEGRRQEALGYAKAAYDAQPRHKQSVIDYSALLLVMHDVATAQEVVKEQKGRKTAFNSAELQRLEAMINIVHYQQTGDATALSRAFALAPSFPATYGTINYLIQQNDPQKAWKAVQRAWKARPHPELTSIVMHYFHTSTPAKLLKYAVQLRDMHPADIESHLMMAQVGLRMQDYPLAQHHLKAALAIAPQQRVYHLLARLEEEGYHDSKAAKAWLYQLNHAKPDPAWMCHACGQIHAQWQLECDGCHRFMTIDFSETYVLKQHSTLMLPLEL